MSEALACFRDLKGIGPATEAKLHEAGVYTWEALGAVASALAAVRGNGDSLHDVVDLVAARRAEAGGRTTPRPPGGERVDAFVLRMVLAPDGQPRRCTIVHVRSGAEQPWASWAPAEVIRFVEEQSGVRLDPSPAQQPAPAQEVAAQPPAKSQGSSHRVPVQDHVVVLDAGKVIGGTRREVELVVTGTGGIRAGFDYRAALVGRRLGAVGHDQDWAPLADLTGTAQPTQDLPLRFPVELPVGVHRLQLQFALRLPAATGQPPALTCLNRGSPRAAMR